jgi:hypothetical protein
MFIIKLTYNNKQQQMKNIYDDEYKCTCAQSQIEQNKIQKFSIINDTNNLICVSKIKSDGHFEVPFICLPKQIGFNLDNMMNNGQNIKIRTPNTEFYACSAIVKPQENNVIKVSDIEKKKWANNIC